MVRDTLDDDLRLCTSVQKAIFSLEQPEEFSTGVHLGFWSGLRFAVDYLKWLEPLVKANQSVTQVFMEKMDLSNSVPPPIRIADAIAGKLRESESESHP